MSINFPPDMYVGQQGHPQCGFFEAFASSADPDCDFFGEYFCHMVSEQKPALVCKGDYLLCPLAYGKSRLTPLAPDSSKAGVLSLPESVKVENALPAISG